MTNIIIERLCADALKKSLNMPYIIALLGARQVGKTTLLSGLLPQEETININFDSGEIRDKVLSDESYLLKILEEKNGGPLSKNGRTIYLCIDEAQKLPESFEIVKQLFDNYSPALKIVLSGSSSLLIKKHTAETLAGRIRFFQLHPFTIEEALIFAGLKKKYENAPQLFEKIILGKMDNKKFNEISLRKRHLCSRFRKFMDEWCLWGFFPKRFHLDGEKEWVPLFRDYVDTYIEKDMRATERIGSLGNYKKLVRLMGNSVGNLINYSKIAATIDVHRETVKEYIRILDESLLGFRLQTFSESIYRRVAKAEKSFFIDNGLAYYFMDLKSPEVLEASGAIGSLYENLIISELKKFSSYISAPSNFYYFRLSGPNPPEVDLICEHRGIVVPIEIKKKNIIGPKDMKGMEYFLAHYTAKKNLQIPYGIIIYEGDYVHLKDKNIYLIPDWFLA